MTTGASSPLRRYFLPCIGVIERMHSSPLEHTCTPPPSPISSCSIPRSKREKRIVSLESGRLLYLTTDDLDTILELWDKIHDKHLWSQRLFLKMFSLKPGIMKIMGYEGMSIKNIMQCERFQSHCRRFIMFWNALINDLCTGRCKVEKSARARSLTASCTVDPCDSEFDYNALTANGRVVNQIRDIGRLHCNMPGVTFDAESWLLFKNILVESVCGQMQANRSKGSVDKSWLSWCKLVMFVVSEMKDAFNECIRTRRNTL